MRLAVLDPNVTQHWMEAHKAGCQHLNRKDRHGWRIGAGAWLTTADSRHEAAEDIAGDFIQEGSMDIEEAIDSIYWAPCLKDLPREVSA